MSRRHFSFDCAGETLVATLDEAPGRVGLLLVSGGTVPRAGAFGGQALLAAKVAEAGWPVLRFDRCGVGDSSGTDTGFANSAVDLAAALAAFRQVQPQVVRVVAFGNCDAASALMLAGGAQCDALALGNPWTFESAQDGPDAGSIRRRYAAKLRNPHELWRLLTGGVSLGKLARGLRKAAAPAPAPSGLLAQMQAGAATFAGPRRFVLAANDRTAQAFMVAWPQSVGQWHVCDGAGHGFAEDHARHWLLGQLLALLDEQACQLDVG